MVDPSAPSRRPSVPLRRSILSAALAILLLASLACRDGSSGPAAVEVEESTTLALAAGPEGDRFVFTLLGSLWAVPVDGGEAERLTGISFRARDPVREPGGERIAFVSVRGERHAIALLHPDSTEPRRLFRTSDRLAQPSYSPDGSRIVFVRRSSDGCDLWWVRSRDLGREQARARRLTDSEACEGWPAWTSDGIVFSREDPEGRARSSGLWRIAPPAPTDSVTSRPELLVGGTGRRYAPRPAARGDLLYLHEEDGTVELRRHPGRETVVADLPPGAGRPVRLVGPDAAVAVPAGGKIWRVAPSGELVEVPFRARVEVRDPDYERRRPDVRLTTSDTVKGIFAPRISPDGGRVAFSAMGDIWVMPLDSAAAAEAVVTGPSEQTMPAWSPDGTRLVYASNRDGDLDLWISRLDGGEARRLTRLSGDERHPVWSPDGDRIAFSFFDNRTTDLFWVPVEGERPRRLTAHEAWNWDLSPSWGPRGERLVFLRRTRDRPVPHAAIVPVDGGAGEPVPVDLADVPVTALAWSAGGELVYRVGGTLRAVKLAPHGTTSPLDVRLGDARAFHPSFSAGGDRLLYLSPGGLQVRDWPEGTGRPVETGLTFGGREPPPPLLIRGVRLIDGTGRGPRGPVDIEVVDGRIVDVAPGRPSEREDRGADEGPAPRVIDGSGLTALPGLIDMHTHLFHYGLRAYLGSGVTTVRDVGFESHLVASRWEGVRSGRLSGPRIVFAGEFLDGPGGPWMGNFVVTVTSPEQVRREVRRLAEFGAGWIKTYVELPPELRLAAIEAAHEHGLPTTQHEIYPALAYGADGKEHVRAGWREDLRAVMRASGARVVPTLETGSGSFVHMRDHPAVWRQEDVVGLIPRYVRASFRSAVEDADSGRAAEMRERHRERVRTTALLREDSVPVAVGTDPTNPYVLFGVGMHWELEHMVEAGYAPVEAIHLATGSAAKALGLEGTLGTVTEGKLADLVLVEGDPAEDIRATRDIRWVVLGGRPVRPSRLYRDPPSGASRSEAGSDPIGAREDDG